MSVDRLLQDAVLRVGEVCAVDGRKVYILVDRNKNLTDLFLDGVSVWAWPFRTRGSRASAADA
jgi:hypothetical protein